MALPLQPRPSSIRFNGSSQFSVRILCTISRIACQWRRATGTKHPVPRCRAAAARMTRPTRHYWTRCPSCEMQAPCFSGLGSHSHLLIVGRPTLKRLVF